MLFLFNTTIMPNAGVYINKKASLDEAKSILQGIWKVPDADKAPYKEGYQGLTSAIGHQGSADAFNALFPFLDCEVNRIHAVMQPGDEAIALKVIGRITEGQILTLEALNEVGFEFYHIKMIENA